MQTTICPSVGDLSLVGGLVVCNDNIHRETFGSHRLKSTMRREGFAMRQSSPVYSSSWLIAFIVDPQMGM